MKCNTSTALIDSVIPRSTSLISRDLAITTDLCSWKSTDFIQKQNHNETKTWIYNKTDFITMLVISCAKDLIKKE